MAALNGLQANQPERQGLMAKNPRVAELARELGMGDSQLLELCSRMGVAVKSAMSTLIEAQADRLRRRAERDGLTNKTGGTPGATPQRAAPGSAAAPEPVRSAPSKQRNVASSSPKPGASESITAQQLARLLGVDLARLLKTCRENGIGVTGPLSILKSQDRDTVERMFGLNRQAPPAKAAVRTGAAQPAAASSKVRGSSSAAAKEAAVWKSVEAAAGKAVVFEGAVTEVVKGGLIVDLGVRAFLPGSLVDQQFVANLDEWVGRRVEVEVIEADAAKRKLVVGRRDLLKRRAQEAQDAFYQSAQPGDIRQGRVVAVRERGIIVDLDGVELFIQERELAKPPREHGADDSVQVAICDIDREQRKAVASTRFSTGTHAAVEAVLPAMADDAAAGIRVVDGVLVLDRVEINFGSLDAVLTDARLKGHAQVVVRLVGEAVESKRTLRQAVMSGALSSVDSGRCKQSTDGFSLALRVDALASQPNDLDAVDTQGTR